VAFALLVSTALLGETLLRLVRDSPGVEPQDVIALQVSLPATIYSSRGEMVAFYTALQRALETRLRAGAVSVVDELPLTGDGGRTRVRDELSAAEVGVVLRTAGPDYFDVMRIPVLAGRTFEFGDGIESPLRAVVSESLAQALLPGEEPIGRQITLAANGQPAEVVGVVGDVRHRALDEATHPNP
jgi:hypothetical protein